MRSNKDEISNSMPSTKFDLHVGNETPPGIIIVVHLLIFLPLPTSYSVYKHNYVDRYADRG